MAFGDGRIGKAVGSIVASVLIILMKLIIVLACLKYLLCANQ